MPGSKIHQKNWLNADFFLIFAMNRKPKKPDNTIKVFIIAKASLCYECETELDRKSWIMLDRKRGALCLSCADLEHLVFLPSGDAALTRRSKKHSRLSAVVLKWSRARRRYERQGLLVEEAALEQAEVECLADEDIRQARRHRAAERRIEVDQQYVAAFAKEVRELFPNCPDDREQIIADHACRKYSGRVGRSAAAKALSEEAVRLAVIAHIRHKETEYDTLLMQGVGRQEARRQIELDVQEILLKWEVE